MLMPPCHDIFSDAAAYYAAAASRHDDTVVSPMPDAADFDADALIMLP